MLRQQVTLSTPTVLNLIRRRGAEPPTVLATTPVWEDERARRQAAERADGELARLGLHGPSGPDREFDATMTAVARPAVEYFGWVNGGYENQPLNYTVLVGAANGEGFVLAHNTDNDVVVLASVPPNDLLDNLVAQLPPYTPGRGRAIQVPKSRVVGGARQPEPEEREISVMRRGGSGPADPQAAEARRVLGLSRIGGGNLYAAARDRTGRRMRAERPVNYIDTVEGRWLTEEVPGHGEPLVTLHPATAALLADRLRTAMSALPTH
ncbi:ESX secretion-associated protein EspG [Saccharomonospora halophila]|uniref:ESX secretion-associated protein EspG n=1 Tax=Saccharomonospora halophila TaxID=129922 RepID=UPI0003A2C2DF|nr:ESX secretion-associated protein EspG [Saccharomonospora halophila]